MAIQPDSAIGRLVRGARDRRPVLRVTLPPRWARFLVAAGARPASQGDSMTVLGDAAEKTGPSPVSSGRAMAVPAAAGGPGGWFLLPELGGLAVLRAGDEDRIVAEAVMPNVRASFFVRRAGSSGRYFLEVVLRGFDDLPEIVHVRFRGADGERLILVPVAASLVGPPSAQVELAGMDVSQRLEVQSPVPARQVMDWDEDTVMASVSAAASEGTREAWRQVSSWLSAVLRRAVERSLP